MRGIAIRVYCLLLLRIHLMLQALVNPLMSMDSRLVSAAIRANQRLQRERATK
jgi:hypothetical protein